MTYYQIFRIMMIHHTGTGCLIAVWWLFKDLFILLKVAQTCLQTSYNPFSLTVYLNGSLIGWIHPVILTAYDVYIGMPSCHSLPRE